MSQAERLAMVNQIHPDLLVVRQCGLVRLSRSSSLLPSAPVTGLRYRAHSRSASLK